MKRNVLSGFLLSAVLLLAVISIPKQKELGPLMEGEAYAPAPDEYFRKILADPATGKIPKNIRQDELAFSASLPSYQSSKREDIWKPRGPFNLGGRTRAFAIHTDNHNTLVAGSATGGIFKSNDAGKSWYKTTCPVESITCLIQDKRPGKTHIWYAGTGELTGSSGSAGGAYYYGAGILKSTDDGETWTQLPSTTGFSPTSFDSDFDGVWNIAIDESNLVDDEIYAAVYSGIFKSTDGGVTWKKKRQGAIGVYSYYTDVAVSPTGVVYACMSYESSHRGIWRSPDGESWTSITPQNFHSRYGRMVLGIAPSDENQVYVLAANTDTFGFKSTNFQNEDEWNGLWKYDYVSGNGSGEGGRWSNRSKKLPYKGGDFGYFSVQGGYNLFVRVHPSDTNIVYVGVTNLWRSNDGFRTNQNTDWIGGYGVNTFRPLFKMYENHHPDQHNLVFVPGQPDHAYSTHDGGISFTDHIRAPEVKWDAKNDHYVTSQFYSVAIDHHTPMSQVLIGGLQDNGTHYTSLYGLSAWHMSFSSDGSFCYVRQGGKDILVSTQLGRIVRLKVDEKGEALEYARLDPAGLTRDNYDFINPFCVDPVDDKILYLPAKTKIYRNSNIEARTPLAMYDSSRWSTALWEELAACQTPSGHEVASIYCSESNPHTLFYGTDRGRLFRVRNAHTSQPVPEDITGTNFSTGNIKCVMGDPSDSNSLFVVFSNYNVISLFYSANGGNSWINVSGNLEANANGSGPGPSCRWANVMKLADGSKIWFVGTSTGLYAAEKLSGVNTVWIKQSPNGIGNTIVNMIDTRQSDYQIAVATHGNGMYSANIASDWQITNLVKPEPNKQFNVYPNPVKENGQLCVESSGLQELVNIEFYTLSGQRILPDLKPDSKDRNRFVFTLNGIEKGVYILKITGTQGTGYKRLILY